LAKKNNLTSLKCKTQLNQKILVLPFYLRVGESTWLTTSSVQSRWVGSKNQLY